MTGAAPAGPDQRAAADDARDLIAFVATRHVACPVCAYDLRGLTKPVCPECSAPLHLAVGSENLRLGAWLLAVVSFALALGFDGVVSVLITVMTIFNPPRAPAEWKYVIALAAIFATSALACLAGLALLVRGRRRWLRLPVWAQWRLGLGIFLAVGVVHAVVGVVVAMLLD